MKTLEEIQKQAESLGLELEEFQPYLIIQSIDKDALDAMYEWCVDNTIYTSVVSHSDMFNKPNEWEMTIDPNWQDGGEVECMAVEDCYRY